MRYADAIWNYMEPGGSLPALVEEFAGFGYDAISFSSSQWLHWDDAAAGEIVEVVSKHDLAVTAHCSFDLTVQDVGRLAHCLGDRLLTVTFDAKWDPDAPGERYAAGDMAGILGGILAETDGTDLLVAVEDFPLDPATADLYRSELGGLLDDPRYGILIDIGHLNLRTRREGPYQGMTPGEYMAQVPLPIIEVHVHDNDGTRDQHGHIGYGNCDFGAAAEALQAREFEGVSTIEIAPGFHGRTPAKSKPDAVESLRKWRELMR